LSVADGTVPEPVKLFQGFGVEGFVLQTLRKTSCTYNPESNLELES